MPQYRYQCTHCQVQETRIAGLDDHLAVCQFCGQVMLRLDLDLFTPYFGEPAADRRLGRSRIAMKAAGRRQAGK